MKIVHICLANFYVDGMGYQENLLPKYHAQEHDVYILTSDYAFDAKGKKTIKEKKEYINEYGIPVSVLEESRRYGPYSRYKDYEGVYAALERIAPDIIFCHGGQFVALMDVVRYCRHNRQVRLFIDQHGDYYNTPVRTFRQRMGQYLIYGHWMRKAVKYTRKFWGVTPWRCEYLHDVYGIPEEKIDFLPMGGDDDKIQFAEQDAVREKIRSQHDIAPEDFLIITGGKIDRAKNIHLLMHAVSELGYEHVKLLVFGQPNDDMKAEIEELAKDSHIRHIGWIPSDAVYDYFLASDLAFFPGTHSVLWEQACACGLPGIFKKWDGMLHVDVGGNALFLEQDSAAEMQSVIRRLIEEPAVYQKMKQVAMEKAVQVFSYRDIARRSIEG